MTDARDKLETETESFRNAEYPAPGGWTLNMVEMDSVTWDLNPTPVVNDDGDQIGEDVDARAFLASSHPNGVEGTPAHSLKVDGELVLTHRGEASTAADRFEDGGLWSEVAKELAHADPDHEYSHDSDAELVTDGGRNKDTSEELRGGLDLCSELDVSRVTIHDVDTGGWLGDSSEYYVRRATVDERTSDESEIRLEITREEPQHPTTDGGTTIPDFNDEITMKAHPFELGSAVNGDHTVQFTFDTHPPTRFGITSDSEPLDGDEWDPEWTTLTLTREQAELAVRDGEPATVEKHGARFVITGEVIRR